MKYFLIMTIAVLLASCQSKQDLNSDRFNKVRIINELGQPDTTGPDDISDYVE